MDILDLVDAYRAIMLDTMEEYIMGPAMPVTLHPRQFAAMISMPSRRPWSVGPTVLRLAILPAR